LPEPELEDVLLTDQDALSAHLMVSTGRPASLKSLGVSQELIGVGPFVGRLCRRR
jgi:hypothetical protein